MAKPVVLVLVSKENSSDELFAETLTRWLNGAQFEGWGFYWAYSAGEARRVFEERGSEISHVLIASVLHLDTYLVADFVQWLGRSKSGKGSDRAFSGPIVVASVDEDCQAAVVKAGATHAIPKGQIPFLLPHISSGI